MVAAFEQEQLECQSCASLLTYIPSIIAGPQPTDRRDRYICRHCGTAFEYRGRTRELRRSS